MMAYRLAQTARLLPNVWMLGNPFKVYEFQQLAGAAGLRPGDRILDLGCGRGMQTQVLAQSCREAVGIDTGAEQIRRADTFLKHSCVQHKVKFLCDTVQNARLSSGSFEKIFSFCVLEHIVDLADVLAELHRLLGVGGELHVTVDSLASINDSVLLERHRREHSVVQYFTQETLSRQLGEAGFRVRELRPIMTSPFAAMQFSRRIVESNFSFSLPGRYAFVRRLRREEREHGSELGVMLLARAQRL
jgi:2-polyprenyl-3-methyl-5-hydroxy-6-metoxy-1,4-benzoquinol methylase